MSRGLKPDPAGMLGRLPSEPLTPLPDEQGIETTRTGSCSFATPGSPLTPLPDEQGIETGARRPLHPAAEAPLTPLPDEQRIETRSARSASAVTSTSLTPLPDEQGIETLLPSLPGGQGCSSHSTSR